MTALSLADSWPSFSLSRLILQLMALSSIGDRWGRIEVIEKPMRSGKR